MADFNAGDTVELKSGSPLMTVKEPNWNSAKDTYEEDVLVCVWFDGNNELQSSTFPSATLKPVDPNEIAGAQ